MFKQISEYFEPILYKFQCGFRKWFSVQNGILAIPTDLPKALNCFSHDLLLAKLNAYGFSLPPLRLVQSYLSNRKQRTTINSEFSSWEEIFFGVPQESNLGPLLFNIFSSNLFFIMNYVEFASYVDDNTPFFVGDNLSDVILKLTHASKNTL